MNLNIARTICGIATEFDVPCQNDGRSWSAAQFREFIDLEVGIPLRVDHGPLINSRGVIMNVGVVRGVAEISNTVNGLLILAEIDHAEGYGDSLAEWITELSEIVDGRASARVGVRRR